MSLELINRDLKCKAI